MVDEKTFYEDPLRVLRLAQFMARFEFQVDLKTKRDLSKKWSMKEFCNIIFRTNSTRI